MVTDELTEFHIPSEGTRAWWIPAREWRRYEYRYRETGLDAMRTIHTPATFQLGAGTYLAIHEAALADYSGMALHKDRVNIFEAALAPASDGSKATLTLPFHTPWRTVTVSDGPEGLADSDLVLNLNEPNVLGDVSWVRPGKYMGIWWGINLRHQTWGPGPLHGATTENATELVRFAAESGIEHVLVEGWNQGWSAGLGSAGEEMDFDAPLEDFDTDAVTDFARQRKVRLMGHHETFGAMSNYAEQMDEAFAYYEKRGVRYMKQGYVCDAGEVQRVDAAGHTFFEYHDGQFAVQHYVAALKSAAEHHLGLIIHEPVDPTGLRRTYSNLMASEGVRGMEYDAWNVPLNPPEHTTILPFTRGLAGPIDYNPGIFDLTPNVGYAGPVADYANDPRARPQTTLAKQLALYVVLFSPLQMVPDLPENYRSYPEASRFVREVPTNWEKSRTMDAEIGDYVVVARQARDGGD